MTQRFASVGLTFTEADLVDLKIENVDYQVTSENQDELYRLFVTKIPQILLRPTSVSEGGVSISRATKSDVEAFYANECKRLGLKDELTKKPKVRFR